MNDDTISRKTVIDAVHTATYGFICGAEDGDEMTDADKMVLSINKAVCNAIKALPTVQPESTIGQLNTDGQSTKTDVISRRAVIDALDALCDRECEYSKQQRGFMCGACRLGSAFDVIDELPSVQPNLQPTCNQLATDCIDRKAAIDVFEERLKTNGYSNVALVSELNRCIGYLMQLPSVQPEIIRCKDCKYCDSYIAEITSDGNMERIEYRCKDFHASVMPDEYCSRGERRDV